MFNEWLRVFSCIFVCAHGLKLILFAAFILCQITKYRVKNNCPFITYLVGIIIFLQARSVHSINTLGKQIQCVHCVGRVIS